MSKSDLWLVLTCAMMAVFAAGLVYGSLQWVISPVRKVRSAVFSTYWWPVLHMPGARLIARWLDRLEEKKHVG